MLNTDISFNIPGRVVQVIMHLFCAYYLFNASFIPPDLYPLGSQLLGTYAIIINPFQV